MALRDAIEELHKLDSAGVSSTASFRVRMEVKRKLLRWTTQVHPESTKALDCPTIESLILAPTLSLGKLDESEVESLAHGLFCRSVALIDAFAAAGLEMPGQAAVAELRSIKIQA